MLAIGLVVFIALLYRAAAPHLLLQEGGAQWIVAPNPFSLAANTRQPPLAAFRYNIAMPMATAVAAVQLHSLGRAELSVNGRLVASSSPSTGHIQTISVDLAPYLHAGANEIVVVVAPLAGRAAILMHAESIALFTGQGWQATVDGRAWSMAKPATEVSPAPAEMRQWNAGDGLVQHLGVLLLLAGLGGAAAIALARMPQLADPATARKALGIWRWLLLIVLAALHVWNFSRMPHLLGMDAVQHGQYVLFLLKQHALPYADQGWQMFQPPLAYLAGALVESLRAWLAPGLPPLDALRIIPLACSLVTAWAACRTCEIVFERAGTAAIAMMLAAFLPASLYMAQAFGNEPVAALFGTLLIYESMRLLKGQQPTAPAMLRIGLWAGLGLLSKPTILLLLPAVLMVAICYRRTGAGWGSLFRPAAVILGVSLLVAGWWYLRNLLHFGRPFVGGWELGRGWDWWQYPGYRVPEHWLRFGESLAHPIYSGLDSFWDTLYSTFWLDGNLSGRIVLEYAPPWNFSAMAALALLSLAVVAAIACGACRGIFFRQHGPEHHIALFAVVNVGIFLAATALIFGMVPAYGAAKGSYLLSVLACFPILAGLGIDGAMQRPLGRAAVAAMAAVWLGFVLLAFIAH